MYIIKSTFICEKHVRQKYILSKYVFLLFTYIGYLHTFDALNWVLQNTWAELSKIHTVKSMCFCFLHIPLNGLWELFGLHCNKISGGSAFYIFHGGWSVDGVGGKGRHRLFGYSLSDFSCTPWNIINSAASSGRGDRGRPLPSILSANSSMVVETHNFGLWTVRNIGVLLYLYPKLSF